MKSQMTLTPYNHGIPYIIYLTIVIIFRPYTVWPGHVMPCKYLFLNLNEFMDILMKTVSFLKIISYKFLWSLLKNAMEKLISDGAGPTDILQT